GLGGDAAPLGEMTATFYKGGWRLARRPKSGGAVIFERQDVEGRALFMAGPFGEVQALIDLEVLRPMPAAESAEFARQNPDFVLPYISAGGLLEAIWGVGPVELKDRLVILGWKGSALKYDAMSSDLKNTSARPRSTTGQRKLARAQAKGGFPGITPGKLWMCGTEVHGSVIRPAWLHAALVEESHALGYQQDPRDECPFSLKSEGEKVEGNVVLGVGDLVGDHFAMAMRGHANQRLAPIEFALGYFSTTKEVDDEMVNAVRGVLRGLRWLASTAAPGLSAAASNIPTRNRGNTSEMISGANSAVKQTDTVGAPLISWSIAPK
ncbi:unnamed protein product, partial [Prorocentrum cordatum]